MKIKKYKSKLIQLQILKLYYKKKSYNFKTSLKQVEIHLNKISNIIYKYHITDKKILFVGFPENFAKILHDTKHIIIPESIWFNGMLSNRTSSSTTNQQTIAKKQMKMPVSVHQLLLRLKRKLDLVIVYNLNNRATAVEESYVARIPVITFSKDLNILETRATYKSPGDSNLVNEKITNNNIFYSLIKTTLNRAIAVKKTRNLKFRRITSDFFQRKSKSNFNGFSNRKNDSHKTRSLKKLKNTKKKIF
jgi:ribosomal protein S2